MDFTSVLKSQTANYSSIFRQGLTTNIDLKATESMRLPDASLGHLWAGLSKGSTSSGGGVGGGVQLGSSMIGYSLVSSSSLLSYCEERILTDLGSRVNGD